MTIGLEKIAKILEGYIELLSLLPILSNVKIESLEASEYMLLISISNTIEHFKYINYNKPMETHREKITYSLSLYIDKEKIEEDTNEIKPE